LKRVLINGWATDESIWHRVADKVNDPVLLNWNDVLQGDFSLPRRCILAGWSLGGQLAMDLSHRPEVAGMVLISSMTCLHGDGERPGRKPLHGTTVTGLLYRSRRGYLKSFFRECGAEDSRAEELLRLSESFPMEELVNGLDSMFNRVACPSTSVRTVVIHGTHDRIVPYATAEYLTDKVLKGSDLISVDGGNHLLPLSKPELIAKVVNDLACSVGS